MSGFSSLSRATLNILAPILIKTRQNIQILALDELEKMFIVILLVIFVSNSNFGRIHSEIA